MYLFLSILSPSMAAFPFRSGDPKGALQRGHRGLGAEDAPRGAHVAGAGGQLPGEEFGEVVVEWKMIRWPCFALIIIDYL